ATVPVVGQPGSSLRLPGRLPVLRGPCRLRGRLDPTTQRTHEQHSRCPQLPSPGRAEKKGAPAPLAPLVLEGLRRAPGDAQLAQARVNVGPGRWSQVKVIAGEGGPGEVVPFDGRPPRLP